MTKRQQVIKFSQINNLHAKGYKGGLVLLSNKNYTTTKAFDSLEEAHSFLLQNLQNGVAGL